VIRVFSDVTAADEVRQHCQQSYLPFNTSHQLRHLLCCAYNACIEGVWWHFTMPVIDSHLLWENSQFGTYQILHWQPLSDWLIEHGFTSAPTQYRLYGRWFLQVWWPNQQCQRNNAHCCHMVTAIKHPVPDRVKPSFVIFDIRALFCNHMATVGVKALICSMSVHWTDSQVHSKHEFHVPAALMYSHTITSRLPVSFSQNFTTATIKYSILQYTCGHKRSTQLHRTVLYICMYSEYTA